MQRLQTLVQKPYHGFTVIAASPASGTAVGRALEIGEEGWLRIEGVDVRMSGRQISDTDIRGANELLDEARMPDIAKIESDDPPVRTAIGVTTTGASASSLEELLGEVDVLIRVLGNVESVRLLTAEEERVVVSRQKSLEALSYLALRESPVDREEVQAALWPDGTNSAKTFHNTISIARKALGSGRDGEELFPEPAGGRYELSERVVTDYGLFHELVARADELDDAETAATLLAEALTLVGGEPFVGVGRGYAWVAPHSGAIVAEVVDAAEELAEVRLATGDWRGAEWAARQGLHIFPCDERLYRLLMRCAHAGGSVAGVQRALQELTTTIADPDGGVEPEDTIHPETVALLEELTGRSSRRASA